MNEEHTTYGGNSLRTFGKTNHIYMNLTHYFIFSLNAKENFKHTAHWLLYTNCNVDGSSISHFALGMQFAKT